MTDKTVILDTPEGIEFYKLAQACGRLKIEIETKLQFRQSTLAAVKRYYGLKVGTKKPALEILEKMKERVLAGEDIYEVIAEVKESQ